MQIINRSTAILKAAVLVGMLQGALAGSLIGQDQTRVEHIVLISIDGFNPQWYQDEGWPAPFLQQKVHEGAYARRVRPTLPSQTRPGHITMLTGWLPARHGVFNNGMPYRLEEGSSIFHAAESAGGVTAAVVWPGSDDAPIDHRVRDLDFIDFSEASTVPPLKGLISAATSDDERGHSQKYERYITGTVRDAQMMGIGIHFIERYQPNVLALRFGNTDAMQHRFGRDAAAVRGSVASTDMGLAEIAAAVDRAGLTDRTVFIVTGDHGMDDIHTVMRPNVWLAEADFGGEDAMHFEAYGGSAFLYDAAETEREEILAMLGELSEETRASFSVLSRARLNELGADPRAVFALTAREGYAFDESWDGPPQVSVNYGRHGSLPTPEAPHNYTGFVAWGPGIEPGAVLDEIALEDVAPTVAALLGIDLGERDGRSLIPRLRGR